MGASQCGTQQRRQQRGFWAWPYLSRLLNSSDIQPRALRRSGLIFCLYFLVEEEPYVDVPVVFGPSHPDAHPDVPVLYQMAHPAKKTINLRKKIMIKTLTENKSRMPSTLRHSPCSSTVVGRRTSIAGQFHTEGGGPANAPFWHIIYPTPTVTHSPAAPVSSHRGTTTFDPTKALHEHSPWAYHWLCTISPFSASPLYLCPLSQSVHPYIASTN